MTTDALDPEIQAVLSAAADRVRDACGDRIGDMVHAALCRTLAETITIGEGGSAFVITGDIPAMWMRDSTTQLTPYLRLVPESPALAELIWAVVRRQFACLAHDSYANAFNDGPTGAHYDPADVCEDPYVWEQKYEIDSLAYPVTLAHRLWRATGRIDVFDLQVHELLRTIVAQLRLEQDHGRSSYRFERETPLATETLAREGRGTPVAPVGLTWSGFRPSDDACTYGYNIPANLFAAQALRAIAELAMEVLADAALAADARGLSSELVAAVDEHGMVADEHGDRHYAYEVDGLGGVLEMDDANTPSLLSLPLEAPDVIDHEAWERTRAVVLSEQNPYYFTGSLTAGIGSSHTLPGRVWPIALAVQGLTGTAEERARLVRVIADTDAGTGCIHESFDPSDPAAFSRPWFSWADSMFGELALAVADDVAESAESAESAGSAASAGRRRPTTL